jgi:hypothetical protein
MSDDPQPDPPAPVCDKMIARTQDGPDPLVPEPGPGKGR